MLAITTRRAEPRSPSRSASTAETADRYPGTSGSTHGARNETKPATRATSGSVAVIASVLVPGELLVHPALEIGVELGVRRVGARDAAPAPGPREHADDHDAEPERRERKEPGEEVEAALRRLGEHGRPELIDELCLDLRRAVAGCDPRANVGLHPRRDGRARLVERRLARGADDLGFEVRLARRARRQCRAVERERCETGREQPDHRAGDHWA